MKKRSKFAILALSLGMALTCTAHPPMADDVHGPHVADPNAVLNQSSDALLPPLLDLAETYRLTNRYVHSRALLELGLDVAPDSASPNAWKARILQQLGRTLTRQGHFDAADDVLSEARQLATEGRDDLTRAAALNAMGNNMLVQCGFETELIFDALTALHEQAWAIHRELVVATPADPRAWSGLGESLFHMGYLAERAGHPKRAAARYREGAAAAEKGGNPVVLGYCLRHLGQIALNENRLAEAELYFRRCVTARSRAGSVSGTGFAISTLATFLYEHRRDTDTAIAWLSEGLRVTRRTQAHAATAVQLLDLARIHLAEHRMDEAVKYGKECLDLARRHELRRVREEAERLLVEARDGQ
ncbi:TPR-MalT domain-containing protein [Sulfidibacter corallicola]|uniref:Tetratricopeptide repeat protein n=1 Tax=Sulfidibacter corallicola TaxID=2818388 RepID=A0A8A4TED8_SULCO|nr:tetratricopeptide repeat protein [Sulfidibacter corallicola]QTD48469.1 hypothetical protein J3U87_23060 [Sulfidibacter corallicola]